LWRPAAATTPLGKAISAADTGPQVGLLPPGRGKAHGVWAGAASIVTDLSGK
jgi:hypothetical protein